MVVGCKMRSIDWHRSVTPGTTTEDGPNHNPDAHGQPESPRLPGRAHLSRPPDHPQNTDQDQALQVASVEETGHHGTPQQPPGRQQERQKSRRDSTGEEGHKDTQPFTTSPTLLVPNMTPSKSAPYSNQTQQQTTKKQARKKTGLIKSLSHQHFFRRFIASTFKKSQELRLHPATHADSESTTFVNSGSKIMYTTNMAHTPEQGFTVLELEYAHIQATQQN